VISVALFALAGILLGGVIQLVKSDATKFSVGITAVLAVLAAAGGFAWWPGEA
jgi:membrane protein DedA with SNARE-associated domain